MTVKISLTLSSSLPIKTISRNSSYLVYFFKIRPKILDILKWKCKVSAILMTSRTFTYLFKIQYWTKMKFSDLINTIELSESINRCIIFKILACYAIQCMNQWILAPKPVYWNYAFSLLVLLSALDKSLAVSNCHEKRTFPTFETLSNY